jgi:hypothetical protein
VSTQVIDITIGENEVEETRKNLLAYCKLDAIAVVRVLG